MENETKQSNLRITNIVCTGRLPIQIDMRKIVKESNFHWVINNENISPILSTKFPREDKTDLNLNKKVKNVCVNIWFTGAVNIVGVLSLEEAQKYFDIVLAEIQRILN